MDKNKLTDEEIIARQERLYQLEFEAGGAFAGKLGTPEEQLEKIKAFFSDDFFEKIAAKVEAKKRKKSEKKKSE